MQTVGTFSYCYNKWVIFLGAARLFGKLELLHYTKISGNAISCLIRCKMLMTVCLYCSVVSKRTSFLPCQVLWADWDGILFRVLALQYLKQLHFVFTFELAYFSSFFCIFGIKVNVIILGRLHTRWLFLRSTLRYKTSSVTFSQRTSLGFSRICCFIWWY